MKLIDKLFKDICPLVPGQPVSPSTYFQMEHAFKQGFRIAMKLAEGVVHKYGADDVRITDDFACIGEEEV